MKSEKFNIVAALAAFLFICSCGLFIGWIGGEKPFTEVAGGIAFLTILAALPVCVVVGVSQ